MKFIKLMIMVYFVFYLSILTYADEQEQLNTNLIIAVENGNREVVKNAISIGADLNIKIKDDVTLLFVASQRGHTEIVKLLLDAKADANATAKKDSATPLMVASQHGHTVIVKLLLEAEADANAALINGATPLFIASERNHSEIVELLLKAKADVNAASTDGFNPLIIASGKGYTEIVNLLLEAKADANVATTSGLTPLMIASQEGHMAIVKLLLEAKADVKAKAILDGEKYTALRLAEMKGHSQIIKLLEGKSFSSGFKVDGDCITHIWSGLTWPRNGNIAAKQFNQNEAIQYAKELSLCGYSDWRVPEFVEFSNLFISGAKGFEQLNLSVAVPQTVLLLHAEGLFTNIQDRYRVHNVDFYGSSSYPLFNTQKGDWDSKESSYYKKGYLLPVRGKRNKH